MDSKNANSEPNDTSHSMDEDVDMMLSNKDKVPFLQKLFGRNQDGTEFNGQNYDDAISKCSSFRSVASAIPSSCGVVAGGRRSERLVRFFRKKIRTSTVTGSESQGVSFGSFLYFALNDILSLTSIYNTLHLAHSSWMWIIGTSYRHPCFPSSLLLVHSNTLML